MAENPLQAVSGAGQVLGRGLMLSEQARMRLEQQAKDEAERLARLLSSGPYSSATLARMAHPYSRRRPHPPQNPAIINRQTGRFASSWRIRARVEGWRLIVEAENTAPYADRLLEGDERMIARPYPAQLERWMAEWWPRALTQLLRRQD